MSVERMALELIFCLCARILILYFGCPILRAQIERSHCETPQTPTYYELETLIHLKFKEFFLVYLNILY